MVVINCVEPLTLSSWILSKNGLLYTKDLTKCDILKTILNFLLELILFVIIVLDIIKAIKLQDNKTTNWMICMLMPLLNYMAKRLTFTINKNCLLSILRDLKSDTFNEHSEQLNRNIQLVNRLSKLTLRYFIFVMTTFLASASVLPFVINIKLAIPFPFETRKFEIFYKFFHLFITSYLALNSTCFDLYNITLMGLGVAQLQILQKKLTHVWQDAKIITRKAEANLQDVTLITQRILKDCIILHERINKFVKKLSILLSFPLFVQYICGCLIICNAILQMTLMANTGSANIIKISMYASVNFAQMAAYHWIGNEIMFKSDKIIESCYLSDWYELDIKSQKLLVMLMERAKRPLVVEVYKLIFISIDSLGVIIRWSYSVFTLIKARYS